MIHRRGVRFVRLFFEVLTIALAIEFALRRRSFERLVSDTTGRRSRAGGAPDVPNQRIERAIRAAYRVLPFERTCLKHALIFCRVRQRRGLSAELRIGVQKHEGVFAAHAWVEDEAGNVLTDPQEGFSPVPLPSDAPRARASD